MVQRGRALVWEGGLGIIWGELEVIEVVTGVLERRQRH